MRPNLYFHHHGAQTAGHQLDLAAHQATALYHQGGFEGVAFVVALLVVVLMAVGWAGRRMFGGRAA